MAVLCIIGALLIIAAIQDTKAGSITVFLFPVALIASTILNIIYITQLDSGKLGVVISLLAGGIGYGAFSMILKFFDKIGWGDVLLIFVVGGSLGWFRITEILIITCIAATIYFIIQKLRKKKMKKKYPFAPFMLIGFAVDIIYGIAIGGFF